MTHQVPTSFIKRCVLHKSPQNGVKSRFLTGVICVIILIEPAIAVLYRLNGLNFENWSYKSVIIWEFHDYNTKRRNGDGKYDLQHDGIW